MSPSIANHCTSEWLVAAIVALLSLAAAVTTSAQTNHKLSIYEFTLRSPDAAKDAALKNALQRGIQEQLDRAASIDDHELIKTESLRDLPPKDEYLEKWGIRYFVEGTMVSVRNDRALKVEVRLFDREMPDTDNPVQTWDKTVTKDLMTAGPWFEKVANSIYSYVEGVPMPQTVFTHCFEAFDDSTEIRKVKRVRMGLPRKLKTILEEKGLGQNYQILSFTNRNEMKDACEDGGGNGQDVQIHEYIIYGSLGEPQVGAGILHVEVTVQMTELDRDRDLVTDFAKKLDEINLLEEHLAERIVEQWSRKIDN